MKSHALISWLRSEFRP